ncbi:Chromo domain protein [Trichophyton rubrum]|nr:Chromo domain protein [Trichophyton rubrum]
MASQGALDRGEDDEDAISLTSTVPSEPQEEYNIAGVLAERIADNGATEYLVSWENYPIHRSSWEPAENFGDPETTLREWNQKKEAITKGAAPEFDLVAFENLLAGIEEAKLRRKRKRRLKRMRLGLACGSESGDNNPESNEEANGDGSSRSSSSDEPTSSRISPASRKKGAGILLPKQKLMATRKSSSSAAGSSDTTKGRTFKTALREASQPPRQLKIPPSSKSKVPSTAPPPIKLSEKPGTRLPIRTSSINVIEPGNEGQTVQPPTANPPTSMAPTRKSVFTFAPATARRGGSMTAAVGSRQPSGPPNNRLFRTLSTQRKYHKMSRTERPPDISQLDLRPPSEWLTAAGRSALPEISLGRKRIGATSMSSSIDDLFVAEDDNNGSLPNNPPPVLSKDSNTNADGKSLCTRIWREWNKGDVMVHLVFSAKEKVIGDIRITGLPHSARSWLLSLKQGDQIVIDLLELRSPKEFLQLEPNKVNHGHVIPYNDTMNQVNNLTEYLLNNQSAAIWRSPAWPSRSIIIYPSQAYEWRFLHKQTPSHPSPMLRLVIINLPDASELRKILLPSPIPSSSHQTQSDVQPGKGPEDVVIAQGYSEIAVGTATDTPSLVSLHEPPRTTTLTPLKAPLPPNESTSSPAQHSSREPAIKPLPERTRDLDVETYFQNHYRITFEYLTRSKYSKYRKETLPVFYLIFPSIEREEHDLIQQLLVFNRIAPYSHRNQGDWTKFIKDVAEAEIKPQGVIICHQKFNAYNCMPKLQELLHHQVNVFSLSLARPFKSVNKRHHIIRLFPNGCVILITEDFILHDPKSALMVIKWVSNMFWDNNAKRGPKLFFRPNIRLWLQQLWPTWPDETLYHIFCILEALIPDYSSGCYVLGREDYPWSLDGETDDEGQPHVVISSPHIPNYGWRSEDEHPDIPKNLTQGARNTDHLVEYFAGWAISNVENFRYFPVLVHSMPQLRWEKWSHIEILNYPAFYEIYMKADIAATSESTRNQKGPSQPAIADSQTST